jgi:hypothetical protein
MKTFYNEQKSVILLLILSSMILLCFITGSMFLTEGHWIYTLDDAYIHMQTAKNLAESGAWGIAPDTFTSCSSSPLWTLLLAGFYSLFGVRNSIPGIANFIACLLILFMSNKTWAAFGVAPRLRILAGLGLLFFSPLTVIFSTGMEHTTHVFFVLLFLLSVMKGLDVTTNGSCITSRLLINICLWTTLATGLRYETWFLVIPSLVLFALQRQWRCCLGLFISASIPVVLFGLYSLAHGGFFLPNSLMLKGRIPDWHLLKLIQQFFSMYVRVSLESVHVHLLCILMLLTSCYSNIQPKIRTGLLVLIAGCVIHLTLSECGRFYRYETYIMAPGLILLGAAWLNKDILPPLLVCIKKSPLLPPRGSVLFSRISLVLLLVIPLLLRGLWASSRITRASANIYEQQWQLARVFKTLPIEQKKLAINDLGIISYEFSPFVLDLWGLGSTEVARLKYAKRYDREAIRQLLSQNSIDYVAVFDQWFPRNVLLPQELILVAKLRNTKNFVCTEDTVMLYALNGEKAEQLKRHLNALPFTLPGGTSIEICL